jgi:hypothetical protein
MTPEAPANKPANSEEAIGSDMLSSSSPSSLSALEHARNNGSSVAVGVDTEEMGSAGTGLRALREVERRVDFLVTPLGAFSAGALRFFCSRLRKRRAAAAATQDTGESGAGGRGAGGHVLTVKNPVGLRGDAPIAIPHSGNVGKSLPRVSMNTIMFSDPHTLDPLGVKHLQKFGL